MDGTENGLALSTDGRQHRSTCVSYRARLPEVVLRFLLSAYSRTLRLFQHSNIYGSREQPCMRRMVLEKVPIIILKNDQWIVLYIHKYRFCHACSSELMYYGIIAD